MTRYLQLTSTILSVGLTFRQLSIFPGLGASSAVTLVSAFTLQDFTLLTSQVSAAVRKSQ